MGDYIVTRVVVIAKVLFKTQTLEYDLVDRFAGARVIGQSEFFDRRHDVLLLLLPSAAVTQSRNPFQHFVVLGFHYLNV